MMMMMMMMIIIIIMMMMMMIIIIIIIVEPRYNDICLYDTPIIASHILQYQLTPHC